MNILLHCQSEATVHIKWSYRPPSILLMIKFRMVIIFWARSPTSFLFSSFSRPKADRQAPKHMRQLTTWQVLCQVERRFHSRESNRQPLPWYLGISPSSSNSLGPSWTKSNLFSTHVFLVSVLEIAPNHIYYWNIGFLIQKKQPNKRCLPYGTKVRQGGVQIVNSLE